MPSALLYYKFANQKYRTRRSNFSTAAAHQADNQTRIRPGTRLSRLFLCAFFLFLLGNDRTATGPGQTTEWNRWSLRVAKFGEGRVRKMAQSTAMNKFHKTDKKLLLLLSYCKGEVIWDAVHRGEGSDIPQFRLGQQKNKKQPTSPG